MRHHTVTTTLDTPPDEVFAYLADIEKLPEWVRPGSVGVGVGDGSHPQMPTRPMSSGRTYIPIAWYPESTYRVVPVTFRASSESR
jgi:uncharacterized protein YndB with AHSA1/START domain